MSSLTSGNTPELPEFSEQFRAEELARASFRCLAIYGDLYYALQTRDKYNEEGKLPGMEPARTPPAITEEDVEFADDPGYIESQIVMASIAENLKSKTPEHYESEFLRLLSEMRTHFSGLSKLVMGSLQDFEVLEVTPDSEGARLTIDTADGLEYYDRWGNSPSMVYNPFADEPRQLGALDLLVMLPHVSRAALQLLDRDN